MPPLSIFHLESQLSLLLQSKHWKHSSPFSPELHNIFLVQWWMMEAWSEPPSFRSSASKRSIRRFIITDMAPTRLKAATTVFTFKTLLRHYAQQALTPRSLNVKLGPRRNYHKGRAAIRHYSNQTARPLWLLRRGPNFTLTYRRVNAHLA